MSTTIPFTLWRYKDQPEFIVKMEIGIDEVNGEIEAFAFADDAQIRLLIDMLEEALGSTTESVGQPRGY